MKPIQRVLSLAVLAVLCGGPAVHAAQPQQTAVKFDVGRQPIDAALLEFSRQTGVQVVLESKETRNIVAPQLNGLYTPEAALRKLLENSGLYFEYLNARTVAIRSTKPKGANTAAPANGELQLARAGDGKEGVEEMLVEGERDKPAPFTTANLDLTRTEDDVLPFTTFTGEEIQRSGVANLEEFFRKRLPQNFTTQLREQENNDLGLAGPDTLNNVNMRGWGAGEVVILVDGRRLPYRGSGTNSDASLRNLGEFSSIPISSIERIELLSSAGSAIYGGNATGGVINIITRRDYKGGRLALTYQTSLKAGAPIYTGEFTYGTPIAFGAQFRMVAAYSRRDSAVVKDIADVTSLRWRQLVLERDPARITNATFPMPGATPNITGFQLFGAGTANATSVPPGYTGAGGTSITPFLNRQGVFNLDLPEGGQFTFFSRNAALGARLTEDKTLNIGIDKELSPNWKLSFEANAQDNTVDASGNSYQNFAVQFVPSSAVTNPFGQQVTVMFDDPRLNRDDLSREFGSRTYRVVASLRGLVGEWRGVLDLSQTYNRNSVETSIFYEPLMGWAAAINSGLYNPFVDLRAVAPAPASFYEEYIKQVVSQGNSSRSSQAMFRLSGPMLKLPAGPLLLTAGVDHSRYKNGRGYFAQALINNLTGEVTVPDAPPTSRFGIANTALYAETTAPLLGERQNIPLAHRLELFASGRTSYETRDGYRTNGAPVGVSTRPYVYAFGLRHDLVPGLALRGSQSIGFKPPSLSQLTPPLPPTSTSTIRDPRRNNEQRILTTAQYITGGNPDLKPETTDSVNFGVIFRPEWAPLGDLRLSVDYVENVREDAIASLTTQTTLNLEADLPGRVQRGAPDGHASGVGPILFVDATQTNFRQIASRSVDFIVERYWKNVAGGRLGLVASASRNLSFKVQASASGAAVEQVRNLNGVLSQSMAWNANAQMIWEGSRWSFGWSSRYLDYILVQPGDRRLQGSDRSDSAVDHDVFVSLNLPKTSAAQGMASLYSGAALTLYINNVLDRDPRFWAASTQGVVSADSFIGRVVRLQVAKDF